MTKQRKKITRKPPTTTSAALLASESNASPAAASAAAAGVPAPFVIPQTSSVPAFKPAIAPLAPNTSLLSRLESFLPQMQRANQELQSAILTQGRAAFDLETVTPGQDRVIQMKLGLGVFEGKPNADDAATSADASSSSTAEALPPLRMPGAPAHPARRPRVSELCGEVGAMDVDDEPEAEEEQDDASAPPATLEEMVMQFYGEPLLPVYGNSDSSDEEDEEVSEGASGSGDGDSEMGEAGARPMVVEIPSSSSASSGSGGGGNAE
ncbi:hypothetical protein H9P43_000880 [Blastocladiella emersonii ATCC 22665]|nr:hypothetical protein H9P43_000880 [Blastocladiella emersonii ATCC 22665]